MSKDYYIPLSEQEAQAFQLTVKEVYESATVPTIPAKPPVLALGTMQVKTHQISKQFAASAGFGDIASVEATGSSEFYIFEISRESVVQGNPTGPILASTYGAYARFLVKLTKFDVNAKFNMANVAAAVELGQAEATIQLQLAGLPDALQTNLAIDGSVFGFSKFDLDKFAKINELISTLTEKISAEPAENFAPVLTGVRMKSLFSDDIESVLTWGNFALWGLVKGWSLKTLSEKATKRKIGLTPEDWDAVRRVYASIMQRPTLALQNSEQAPDGARKPSNEERTRARRLIRQFEMLTDTDGVTPGVD